MTDTLMRRSFLSRSFQHAVHAYLFLFLATCMSFAAMALQTPSVEQLVEDIESKGQDPFSFSLGALQEYDLLIFDDALHNTVEPFEFYQQLMAKPGFREMAPLVFFEIFTADAQGALDAYMNAPEEDISLLFPAFHKVALNGWRYRTYLDTLKAMRSINAEAPEGSKKLRAVAVSPPTHWNEIESPEDFSVYDQSTIYVRDYYMYRAIDHALAESPGAKGIFLTNTRHAYTGLKDKEGKFIWNTATYFAQWQPGRALSIRFNAPFLNIEKKKEKGDGLATSQGLEKVSYSWVRAADGNWDKAFAEAGDRPVAIPLRGTAFGQAPYVGNRMLVAAPGQTMADVNDVVIHLKALKDWRQSGSVHEIYTDAFKAEVARRYRARYSSEDLAAFLKRREVESIEAYIDALAEPEAGQQHRIAQSLTD